MTPVRDFCFTELRSVASPGLWASLIDRIGPRAWRTSVAVRAASRYLDRLLLTNSARVANDLVERVAKSQAALERSIRQRLTEAVPIAERAVLRAKAVQSAGREGLDAALASLEDQRRQVDRLMAALDGGEP